MKETYSKLSDLDLFGLFKKGNQLAFLEIYDRYKVILQNHAYRKLGDMDEVEDILQELFIYLWEKRDTIHFSTSVRSYLYTAIRNRIINHFYRKHRESEYLNSLHEFVERGEFITDLAIREKEFAAIIQKEIDALPPRMREVFMLHRNHELTYKQIAEQLGTSEQTVATQVKNSLKVLRGRLGACFFLLLWLYP